MNEYLQLALTFVGGMIGAFIGMRSALATLQAEMRFVMEEIKSFRKWKHDEIAPMVQRHEFELDIIKRRLDLNIGD